MPYSYRDIVNTKAEYGGYEYIILEPLEGEGYRTVALHNRKRYTLTEEQINACIGQADATHPLLQPEDYDQDAGYEYAFQQAEKDPDEQDRWLFLAELRPGQQIKVIHRRTIYLAEFVQINIGKPRYVFRAKILGKTHDLTLNALDLGLQQKKNGV